MTTQSVTTDQAQPAAATLKTPPRLSGTFLLGNLPEAAKDFLGVMVRAAELNDVTEVRLAERAYLLVRPELVKRVLQDNHVNYRKGAMYSRMVPLVGQGLLTSEGDFWKRQRRLAQPAFHRQRIAAFAEVMARRTTQMLERWDALADSGTPFDAHEEMMALTLAIVGETLFSVDLTGDASEVGKALGVTLKITDERFRMPVLPASWIPIPSNVRFNRAKRVLDGLVDRIIGERRAKGEGHEGNDLLAMLMEARDDEGKGMSDAQLSDEVMTLMLAGHETTANALSWWIALMSKHPTVAARQVAEAREVLQGREAGFADLPKLGYTLRTFEETMRLYPPAYIMGRRAIAEDDLGGYRIPAGATVFVSPFITGRDARYWDNPEGFDPDRFLPERSAKRPPMAYFPFAAGPRQCIGNSFALMEMQVIGAMIAQRFQLDLVPNHKLEMDPQVTLRPRYGVKVVARRRLTA